MLAETIIALFAGSTPALTALERIQALKRTEGSFSIVRPWAFLAGILAIIGLVLLLCFVHGQVIRKREARAAKGFNENTERYGLTFAEHRLLMTIARLSGISDTDLIFSTQDAFCLGAAKLMHERYAAGDSIQDRHKFREAIELVHRKLGFAVGSEATPGSALGPSSRQIPVGRQVSVVTVNSGTSGQTEATVIANDDDGLTLKPDGRGKFASEAGDKIRIRYNFATSTWEFESTVTGLTDSEMNLAHSDLARFANRRRFLRVPAQGKAMVARYSFEPGQTNIGEALPNFVPAEVTEIAGPGVRIQTALETSSGERLLVIISMEGGMVVRDIAEVKHVQPISGGFSAALELVTLSDAEVSTLVRLTNQAAKKLGPIKHTETESVSILAEKA